MLGCWELGVSNRVFVHEEEVGRFLKVVTMVFVHESEVGSFSRS